jgi:hypothetical protein
MIMDKRLLTLLSVTIACFVFFAVGTLTADDMPQEIQIASEGYEWKITALNATNATMTIRMGKISGKKGAWQKML